MDRSKLSKLQVLLSLKGKGWYKGMIPQRSSWSYFYYVRFNITSFRSSLLFPTTELLSNSHVPSRTFLS